MNGRLGNWCAGACLASAIALTHPALAQDVWHVDFGGDFELVNAAGETVTDDDLHGKLSLIYFGYTSCLMQCPPTWINLDQVARELGEDAEDVDIYFISIDPDRDSVEVIAAWQQNWPHITALTGTREQIHDVTEAFHVFFAKKPMHAMPFTMDEMARIREAYGDDDRILWDATRPENFYMMDHTMQTFLLGRDGEYLTHFELEEDAATIIEVLRTYL